MTLVDLLRTRAEETPEAEAYTFLARGEHAESWTWAQLWSESQAVAAGLQVEPGDRVLIAMEEGLEFLAALFGCMHAGALAVPVHPPDPDRLDRTLPRLKAVVADSTPRAVLGDVQIELPLPAANPHEGLAYLQYTSGSTAAPKGVMISHANLIYQLRDFDHGYAHAGGRIVSWLPATHDLGLVYGRFLGLHAGIPTTFMSPRAFVERPRRWLEALSAGGTHSPAPNFGYALAARRVREISGLDLSHVRVLLNGAEPIRSSAEAAFFERFAAAGLRPTALTHAMGMSEATAKIVSESIECEARFLKVDAEALKQNRVVVGGSIEVASNGSVVDAKGFDTEVSVEGGPEDDRVGEIWVRGQTVARGYWGQPDHPDFAGGWLHTGDLGFLHEGELYLVGRSKDVLIVRGENHHPPDLEASISASHPDIRLALAFQEGDGVAVALELRRPASVFPAARAALAAHGLAPTTLVVVPPRSLPLTSSGKLQRQATRIAFEAGALEVLERWQPVSTEVAGDTTSIVLGLAAARLGLSSQDVERDVALKELGLDSVTAVELVEDMARALGGTASASVLFDHPTLDALIAYFDRPPAPSIAEMSEAEAEAALLAELEDL